ncbi:hypothetical protein WN55_10942 [Dufourea novaeangliae]|uniref:Uncharacterized protein n=1 Tax=Dufourea novaeangliae TaxID=178035 RepID=A0A154P8G0_DUFNO|nr:hypothetical protein WN55_10942 [Dufourea novaeangliae]
MRNKFSKRSSGSVVTKETGEGTWKNYFCVEEAGATGQKFSPGSRLESITEKCQVENKGRRSCNNCC